MPPMPSRDFAAFDPLAILTSLREVEYLVVGGFAAVLYGSPTTTGDLDVMPRADAANLARLAGVLAALDAVVREPASSGRRLAVTLDLLRRSAAAESPGGQLRTRTTAGPIDVLWRLHDGRRYEDLVGRSAELSEDELRVRVLGLDDLIDVKASVGRPQDLLVLPYLREIRRRA